MIFKKIKLNEDMSEVTIYVDDSTGKKYIFNGTELIELPSSNNDSPTIGSRGDASMDDEEAQWDSEETDEEREERVRKIKDAFENNDTKDSVKGESQSHTQAERIKRQKEREQARKNINGYGSSSGGIEAFKLSINHFIKNAVQEVSNNTWAKLNKKYSGTGILKPGVSKHKSGNVPLINVYYDHSGSWDEAKIKVGDDVMTELKNKYVKKKLIRIETYYFGTRVSANPDETGGATYGKPIMEHIAQTKPDNVVIMTDSDIWDLEETTTVKGGVWLLFKGSWKTTEADISTNLVEHIKGKKMTKIFLI